MEQNLDSPVMRIRYEAEPIEGLTSLSSPTQKSPNDALASSFDGKKPVKAMPSLKVGKLLGSGAYGVVYHATTRLDESTQLVLALKKSRTSRRVKRPSLKHEARVLQLLRGHPAIPSVYGYGRFPHFDYLAMELLASSLEDLHKDHAFSLRAVLSIANQMLSALGHIHAHGIIHRDIKPSNILIGFNNQLRLIDFGIARLFIPGESIRHTSPKEAYCVVGTLDWASLHAHLGYELGLRDDLESLSYLLLFFLRGDLPWRRYLRSTHGTLAGRAAQVRQKKITWTGSMLAGSHPASFGHLLDSVRSLSFRDNFDYDGWRSAFQKVSCDHGYSLTDDIDWTVAGNAKLIPPTPTPSLRPSIPPCVVRPGQLVYVQVLSRFTIEGHSCQADASYWHDPDLSGDYLMTKRRPAIVLQTRLKDKKYYVVKVVPIKLGPQAPGSTVMRLTNKGSATDACSLPGWPLLDAFCYVFPHLESFASVPQAAPVPAHWRMRPKDVKSLLHRFHYERSDMSPEDSSNYKQMECRSGYETYADFTPMTPENIVVPQSDNVAVDWFGGRGWFDEILRINRKRSAQDGAGWPSRNPDKMKDHGNYPDSYWGTDIDAWHIHGERGRSLTLPESEAAQLDGEIDIITDVLDDKRCSCEHCQENVCPS